MFEFQGSNRDSRKRSKKRETARSKYELKVERSFVINLQFSMRRGLNIVILHLKRPKDFENKL